MTKPLLCNSVLRLFVGALAALLLVPESAFAQPAKLKDEMRLPWQRPLAGYLRSWLVLGEFPNPDRKALDVDFLGERGGEAQIRPAAGMTHKRPDGSQAVWTQYTSDRDIVNFLRAFPGRPASNVVAYAFTTIDRPAAGKALLSLGSDDGVAVWLNGERVHHNPASRAVTPDEDQVEVYMPAGVNSLLLKVEQGAGDWGFILRVLEPGAIPRAAALSASIQPSESGTLTLTTNSPGDFPVKVEVMAAGGRIQAEKTAPRGANISFPTASWPEGAYEIRVTAQDWQGRPERAFLPWFKGDALAALKNLVATAPKGKIASADAGHHAMLAEMVLDRMQGKLDSLDRAPLPTLYTILMEFQELEQQRKGGPGPVHSSGFVRLAYQDDIDGSTQFCRAYLPGSYDPSKKWPLVLELHGYNAESPVYVRWWSVDARHNGLAERHNIIFVEPHGRGNTSYYGIGDRDVLRCMQLAKEQFRVDDDRVYLTGQSMGGGGTWHVATRHPELFAAIAPVFGGWDYHVILPEERLAKLTPRERYLFESQSSYVQADSLLNLPIFVNHGDADQSVNVDQSRYAVRMLQRWGYNLRYREHPGKGHGGLGNDDEMIDWLLQYKRDLNPPRVRVRAADLKSASAYWVRIDQRADQRAFMVAGAEVVGPNAIRLDTDNVLAVTLSPASPLIDPAKPLWVSWNGAPAQSVPLKDGRVTLYADGYAPAPLRKTASVAGPMADVKTTPFAVVVGTISPDPMMRELCNRKAEALASDWKNWQHVPLRLYKDTEIPETELSKYSLLLIGASDANAVTRKLAGSLPLKISGDEISIDGRSFKAPDAAVAMVYPHPLNPERYVLLAAATSPAGMYFLDPLDGDLGAFDFAIVDGALANSHRGRPVEKIRVAAGLFDRNWRIADTLLDKGDPEIRAKAPLRKVRPDLTTALVGVFQLTPELLDAYAGQYQVRDATVTVTKEGDRLVAHVPNQPPMPLYAESETVLAVEGADIEINVFRDSSGKVTGLMVRLPNQPAFPAKKIK
ncbi:MAG: prolyl oligopeptidase family serine peptidase [Bryobacteraceae bacterium]